MRRVHCLVNAWCPIGLCLWPTLAVPAAVPPCAGPLGPAVAVARILDSETIQLADGREIRLVGALAPRAPFVDRDWPPEADARAALATLLMGTSVKLGAIAPSPDRHGRILAQVFVDRMEGPYWVQGALITAGHARAYGLPGHFACLPDLLALERTARMHTTGLWAERAYRPRPAWQTRTLTRDQSTFQIVEGVLVKAVKIKQRLYLNFGSEWRSDFTAGIDLAGQPDAETLVAKITAWEGSRLTVRGWIERRNGPYIEIWDFTQIVRQSGDGFLAEKEPLR